MKTFVVRMGIFGTAAVLAAGLMAEDVTLERFGMLRCSFGGGITVGGLINYDNWGNSAQPTLSVSNMTGYVLSTHGNMFAKGRWALGSDGTEVYRTNLCDFPSAGDSLLPDGANAFSIFF